VYTVGKKEIAMTFTKLTLRNFQCHRRLEIPLSQITTIVGSSDSGKSATIRALNYLCLNNLRGNSFITHGKDKCAITLEVDGQQIQRSKTKTSNSYATETNELLTSHGMSSEWVDRLEVSMERTAKRIQEERR